MFNGELQIVTVTVKNCHEKCSLIFFFPKSNLLQQTKNRRNKSELSEKLKEL